MCAIILCSSCKWWYTELSFSSLCWFLFYFCCVALIHLSVQALRGTYCLLRNCIHLWDVKFKHFSRCEQLVYENCDSGRHLILQLSMRTGTCGSVVLMARNFWRELLMKRIPFCSSLSVICDRPLITHCPAVGMRRRWYANNFNENVQSLKMWKEVAEMWNG